MKIVIPIKPESKGRPRFERNGHAYTPQKTRAYEDCVRILARRAVIRPMEGEIYITIHFYLPIPKSWSKRKKQLAMDKAIRPTVTPDIDNLAKAILDGLNGIVYADDKQIVDMTLRKFYGEEPRTEIEVEEL